MWLRNFYPALGSTWNGWKVHMTMNLAGGTVYHGDFILTRMHGVNPQLFHWLGYRDGAAV
jgi:hypothetical protein